MSESDSLSQLANNKVRAITQGVGSHNALTIGQNLIKEISKTSESENGLRYGSVKEIVAVSDDNAHTNPEEFREWAKKMEHGSGPVHVNGIVRMGKHCGGILSTFSDAKPGTTYQTIASFPETKGAIEELCSNDWASVFENLARQLSEKKQSVKNEFQLPQPVQSPQQVQIYADERPLSYPDEWQIKGAFVEILANINAYFKLTISVQP